MNIVNNETVFESIKHIDEEGNEYWSARELQNVLNYVQWRKFEYVIKKAMVACNNSNYDTTNHFALVGKMVSIGSNAGRKIDDYRLTRYACYLIAQNGDSKKRTVALAQTYFSVQTRKQELFEQEISGLTEIEKRIEIRKQTRIGNKSLNKTAINSGVKNLDKFHNSGYKGLYNGETADDIAKRKKLRYGESLLDNMNSEEGAINLFRITQTDAKLKKENLNSEKVSNEIHYKIGKNIREVIKKNGGTMPEELPTPKESLKLLKKHKFKELNNSKK